MQLTKFLSDSPGRTVLLSIFLTIWCGTFLLLLPTAQNVPISFIDCLFTATSSTCVTGVLPVPFDSFTFFGKCVILGLMQIGGIGLLTLWLFLVSLFVNLGISTHYMLGQVFELTVLKSPRSILSFIIGFTLISEFLGTLGIYATIAHLYPVKEGLFYALFHSVSSFCNAGLSIFGQKNSLIAFKENIPFLLITGLLILLGSIGFITIYELFYYVRQKWLRKRVRLSLTTKVVIPVTALLIMCVTLLLIFIEGPSHFGTSPWHIRLTNMIFNAIAYRGTGLTTIDITTMQTATVFMIITYSFIGASPVSTGSGIKVTTLALCLATIRAVIRGRLVVELKGRRIPQDQIFKTMAILALSICWVTTGTFFLALIERGSPFISVLFETVSSFTNLGLATDITPTLSFAGKILVIISMFMGRVGTLTLMLALKVHKDRAEFQYPEERLMIS